MNYQSELQKAVGRVCENVLMRDLLSLAPFLFEAAIECFEYIN
jgi:hypothetical protein